MELGDILVAKGLVRPEDLEAALQRQQQVGGRIGDSLVNMGLVTESQIDEVMRAAPVTPKSLAATGISEGSLLKQLIKCMYTANLETPAEMSDWLKLPTSIINSLIKEAIDRKYVDILGSSGDSLIAQLRHSLTAAGREWAVEALAQSQYVGPAPINLEAYCDRILAQKIGGERVSQEAILEAFSDLIVPDEFIRRIGPGVNSGLSILLYGPAGNGKTSVAEKIGAIFEDVVYIPYCIEVEGQIIKIFDPSVHIEAAAHAPSGDSVRMLRREAFDARYVACRRPVVITGGELTLEMLDLKFNPHAMYYEAPLHMKALNGTFIIDDFGRQFVSPEQLLNRWIVPLQSRVDYLKLHTGKSFSIPFDELVIFSTNMSPNDLMDPAFLRRIPYKLETKEPSTEDFYHIFKAVAANSGLDLDDDMFRYIVDQLQVQNKYSLACYQPKYIIDQVLSACKFAGVDPHFDRGLVTDALANLYTDGNWGEQSDAAAA